jgi:hypothetical protein
MKKLVDETKDSPSAKRGFRIRWSSIAIISAIITLSGWALSSPIGSSPDDDYHLPSIWCGQGFRDGLCEKAPEPNFALVPYTTFGNSVCFQNDENKSGACPYDQTLVPQSRVNYLENTYPPVYYWTMSWIASDNIDQSTVAMRIANSIIGILGLALVTVFLPKHLRRIPIVSTLVSALPLGVFLISSTNPSGWTYFSSLIFFSAYLGFLHSINLKTRIIFGSLAGLSLTMAAGSRPDAAVYAVITIGVALWIGLSKNRYFLSNILFSAALVVASLLLYLSVRTGSAVAEGGLALPSEEATTPNFFVNFASLPNLWIGVFGTSGLGWLDTEMPAIVWAVTLSIFTGLIFSSVRWFSRKQTIAVSGIFFVLIALPLYVLTVNGLSVGQQIQPRYLLPLMALLVGLALFRRSSVSGLELTRGQVWIVGAGLFIANTISLHLNARRYITGMDQQGVDLNKNIEWWWSNFPLSPNLVTWSASVAFAIFLVAIWKLREPLGLPGITKEVEAK